MAFVAIVVALALMQYMYFAALCGQARGRFNVAAPSTSGNPAFERQFRVQANTVEQLVIFLPALFLFATFVSEPIAAGVGLIFVLGRGLYAHGYAIDPSRRGPGFLLTFVSNGILLAGGLIGAIVSLI